MAKKLKEDLSKSLDQRLKDELNFSDKDVDSFKSARFSLRADQPSKKLELIEQNPDLLFKYVRVCKDLFPKYYFYLGGLTAIWKCPIDFYEKLDTLTEILDHISAKPEYASTDWLTSGFNHLFENKKLYTKLKQNKKYVLELFERFGLAAVSLLQLPNREVLKFTDEFEEICKYVKSDSKKSLDCINKRRDFINSQNLSYIIEFAKSIEGDETYSLSGAFTLSALGKFDIGEKKSWELLKKYRSGMWGLLNGLDEVKLSKYNQRPDCFFKFEETYGWITDIILDFSSRKNFDFVINQLNTYNFLEWFEKPSYLLRCIPESSVDLETINKLPDEFLNANPEHTLDLFKRYGCAVFSVLEKEFKNPGFEKKHRSFIEKVSEYDPEGDWLRTIDVDLIESRPEFVLELAKHAKYCTHNVFELFGYIDQKMLESILNSEEDILKIAKLAGVGAAGAIHRYHDELNNPKLVKKRLKVCEKNKELFGITHFGRYEPETLEENLQNLETPNDGSKPICLSILNQYDWNTAFETNKVIGKLGRFSKGYRFVNYETDNSPDIFRIIKETYEREGEISVLLLGGHGTSVSMCYGHSLYTDNLHSSDDIIDSGQGEKYFSVLDQEKLAELEYCFAPDAKIVLMGCSNAKKNYWSNEDNLMKSVSKALPGRRVYAPKEDCNVINPKFYKTGLLKTVQFQWWDDMEGKSIRNLSASICQR